MPDDDRDIMSSFMRTGDTGYLAALYERHQPALRRFLQRLTRDRALAEDLAQHTWIKIMDAASRGRYAAADSTFKSYLYTLARNTFLDECTRKHETSRRLPLTDSQFEQAVTNHGDQLSPETVTQRVQSHGMLRQALATLPSEQRDVLKWWCGGDSIVAMANLARVPRDTVLSRKKYALARMRQWLERSGTAASAF
ncbi:MAG TPA: sigma-70 family RNA polymerase sigma factor [Steroidobacteraceae bacterium]|nr:sigma-70 family RNA polymerase sigma factor [Steroidobacteraceae bacterium]